MSDLLKKGNDVEPASINPLPPANFVPNISPTNELKPFRVWCQKVLPLVYGDELSYYELLCKTVDYLNTTMENVDIMEGDFVKLHAAFVQLQNYVNTYFSSLDVQQEINNKLDALVEDGTLTKLLTAILKTHYPKIVDSISQMTDHNQIYVLATDGFLYYWNGSTWTNSGIVYGVNPNVLYSIVKAANADDLNNLPLNSIAGYYETPTPANAPYSGWLGNVITIHRAPIENAVNSGATQIAISSGGLLSVRQCWGADSVWGSWDNLRAPLSGMMLTIPTFQENPDLDNLPANTIGILPAPTPTIGNLPVSTFSGLVMTLSVARKGYTSGTGKFQFAMGINNEIYVRSTYYSSAEGKAKWREWTQIITVDSKMGINVEMGFNDFNSLEPNSISTEIANVPDNSPTDKFLGTVFTFSGNMQNGQWGWGQLAVNRYNEMFFRVCWRSGSSARWDSWKRVESKMQKTQFSQAFKSGVDTSIGVGVTKNGIYKITVVSGLGNGVSIGFNGSANRLSVNGTSTTVIAETTTYLHATVSGGDATVVFDMEELEDGFTYLKTFSDFNMLGNGAVAIATSSPQNLPYDGWIGTAETGYPYGEINWGSLQKAFDRYGRMHFRHMWSPNTPRWTQWNEVVSYAGAMEYSFEFTKASEMVYTPIELKGGSTYLIEMVGVYPLKTDGSYFRALSTNSSNEWANMYSGYKYTTFKVGKDGYLRFFNMANSTIKGTIIVSVKEINPGYIPEFDIGEGYEYTSFTQWCLDYGRYYLPKKVKLHGTFDIWKEYQESGVPILDDSSPIEPSTGYWPYSVMIPPYTSIYGVGKVLLTGKPTSAEIGVKESQTLQLTFILKT